MVKSLPFLIALIAAMVVVAIYIVSLYNRLVKSRQMVMEGWSGIEVQLKRRANLIPNLVETVKGHVEHEQAVVEDVTRARSAAAAIHSGNVEERAAAEAELGNALGSLLALAEDTPALKSSNTFGELQSSLATVESEIQMARRYFNATVRDLNTRIESFPSSMIAQQMGFQQYHFFEVENAIDRAVPNVSFEG